MFTSAMVRADNTQEAAMPSLIANQFIKSMQQQPEKILVRHSTMIRSRGGSFEEQCVKIESLSDLDQALGLVPIVSERHSTVHSSPKQKHRRGRSSKSLPRVKLTLKKVSEKHDYSLYLENQKATMEKKDVLQKTKLDSANGVDTVPQDETTSARRARFSKRSSRTRSMQNFFKSLFFRDTEATEQEEDYVELSSKRFEKLLSIPLGRILDDYELERVFFEFLQLEHSSENLKFLRRCKAFKDEYDQKDYAHNCKEANAIIKSFVVHNAPNWVCTSNTISDTLLEKVQHGDIEKTLFDAAYMRIHNEMQFDMFPRFIETLFPRNSLKKKHFETWSSSSSCKLDSARSRLYKAVQPL